MNKFFCWFVKVTGWLPWVILRRPKYYYQDKKVQSRKIRGKAIVMPNHFSVWDFATILFAFPSRNLRCIVAEVMFNKNKTMAKFLKGLGAIKVDREGADFAFMDKSCKILDEGGVVEIYPESRLPKKDEETPLPFKDSVTYLALSTDAPIIPVVTNGNHSGKGRMRVLIGKPIDIKTLLDENLDEKQAIISATEKLRGIIIEMNDELKRKTEEEKKKK